MYISSEKWTRKLFWYVKAVESLLMNTAFCINVSKHFFPYRYIHYIKCNFVLQISLGELELYSTLTLAYQEFWWRRIWRPTSNKWKKKTRQLLIYKYVNKLFMYICISCMISTFRLKFSLSKMCLVLQISYSNLLSSMKTPKIMREKKTRNVWNSALKKTH